MGDTVVKLDWVVEVTVVDASGLDVSKLEDSVVAVEGDVEVGDEVLVSDEEVSVMATEVVVEGVEVELADGSRLDDFMSDVVCLGWR
jgi:hypothetical protein